MVVGGGGRKNDGRGLKQPMYVFLLGKAVFLFLPVITAT